MRYLHFAIQNRRFLAFGFLLTFFASTGQTYFIALFSDPIRAEFGLSHGDFGGVYSAATLASAASLMWLGRKIDDVDLRHYAFLVCAGLVVACLLFAWAPTLPALAAGLFALRLTGQGLLGHTAVTSMARYFGSQRGKAMSIASLGHPVGEAVFPLLAVALLAALGWRASWVALGLGLAVLMVPAVLWLLRGHGNRHARHLEALAAGKGDTTQRQWSRGEVLRDLRFYIILPSVLAPAFILTGMFFHQVHLANYKGWSLTWLATGFIVYAGTTLLASLTTGPQVDRLGAARLLPFYLLPLGTGLLALSQSNHPATAMIYLGLAGLTTGASMSIVGALWAEVYGVAHLGAIRSLVSALMVFSTALSPALFGWLLDGGVTMDAIAGLSLGYVGIGTALAAVFFITRRPGLNLAE